MVKLSRKEQAIQTEQKIIQSTLQLINIKPFQKLHIKDICVQADISIGTFYHYFDNKQAIIVKILDLYSEQFVKNINENTLAYSQEKIVFIFLEFCYIAESLGPDLILEIFIHNIILHDNFLLSQDRNLYQEVYKCIKELKIQDLLLVQESEQEIANTLIVFFRGFLYEWGLSRNKYSLVDEISKQLNRYLPLFIKFV
ncbi:MAG: TetR/AcrR family transcriptional regulator [Spirochaetota bacterium]|nr:TetR/AcrR family transcriptional regulator [Spirochaetota bacterium]